MTIFTVFGQKEKTSTINRTVEQINNDNSYTVKQILNDYYVDRKNIAADNGQELKGYYIKGQLKKIVYTIGISCCKNTFEYYFTDGSLIFVHENMKPDNAI